MSAMQKALYNSLRQNWINDPSIAVKPWQVEDYRSLSLEALFDRLKRNQIQLDRMHFIALADQFDTPEDLTDGLFDEEIDHDQYDQIYLVIFELWRRLISEKLSISIICDEIDYQIFQYDQGQTQSIENILVALDNLHQFLEDNLDQGANPEELFQAVCELCANDIEAFLYDFIADQLDQEDIDVAQELIDDFYPYVVDKKWFDFLLARVAASTDLKKANLMIEEIFKSTLSNPEVQLNLDMLNFMVQRGDIGLFRKLAKQTIDLIHEEEDCIDLMMICSDFFSCLDQEDKQEEVDQLIVQRQQSGITEFHKDQIEVQELIKILSE